jgi:hypothetical protein
MLAANYDPRKNAEGERFDVFTAVRTMIIFSTFSPEDEDSVFLRNVGIYQ